MENTEQKDDTIEFKGTTEKKLRQIVIETDGNMVRLIKAEIAGQLELSAILHAILNTIER